MRLDLHTAALKMVQKRLLSYAPPPPGEGEADCGEADCGEADCGEGESKLVSDTALRLMLADIDDAFTLDEELAELLRQSADDLIRNVVDRACALAKHRGSDTVGADDAAAAAEYSRVKRARRSVNQKKYSKTFRTIAI